jgi:glycosyltransferase involved in cell wall biosynthesis
MKQPHLTVVMPVYNGQKYLREAIDSVLSQTYKNFELLIIDDGSTDNSLEIINTYSDDRIRLLKNGANYGVGYTRNVGLDEAKGDYLAWMDCDDIIHPKRFEKQIKFLQENPKTGICGTWGTRIGEGLPRPNRSSTDPKFIKAALFFYPPFNPATAMYNMALVKKAGLRYDPRLLVAEDYDYYFEASFHFPINTIPELLYSYRASETSIMKHYAEKEKKMMEFHKIIYSKGFDILGLEKNDNNFILHRRLMSPHLFDNWTDYKNNFHWLVLLKSQNQIHNIYDQYAFGEVLGKMFYFISKKSSQLGLEIFLFYLKNHKQFTSKKSGSLLRLFVRCFIKYKRF